MDSCREADAQNNYKNREKILQKITKMQQNLLHDVFDFDTQSPPVHERLWKSPFRTTEYGSAVLARPALVQRA